MKNLLKNLLIIIGQLFFLWATYYVSTWIVKTLNVPFPGSVLGMIILFALLSTGVVKEQWLTAAANPLLKHMTFFFVPIAVELMEWGDLFIQYLLLIPLVVSTIVGLLITGGIYQFLNKDHQVNQGELDCKDHQVNGGEVDCKV